MEVLRAEEVVKDKVIRISIRTSEIKSENRKRRREIRRVYLIRTTLGNLYDCDKYCPLKKTCDERLFTYLCQELRKDLEPFSLIAKNDLVYPIYRNKIKDLVY